MKKALLLILILPLLIIAACTGSAGDTPLERIPVKDIKQQLNRNSGLIETLEASGNISFDSPEQSGSGWIELKIKKPDTVFVKIEGPFGISIANALITRKDFIYYNAQENKAITGPSTDINIGAILRIKVSFDELISGFTGSFSFQDQPEDSTSADSEKNLYVIRESGLEGNRAFYVDPSSYTIQRYKSIDANNSTLVEVNYSKYNEESASGKNIYLPSVIKIKNPGKKQTVYVDYVDKVINKRNLTFKMKIPKSAKIIEWE